MIIGGDLPPGYKQVEYLQTDEQGNAYIDTQYIYDIDSSISCEYLFDIRDRYTIFGIRSPNYKMVAVGTGTDLYYDRSTSKHSAGSFGAAVSTKYQIWQEPKRLVIKTLETQQVRYNYTDDNYQNDTNASLFIFTDNVNGNRGTKSKSLRMYSFSITKNGEKVVDLVPCLDNKKVPCFYDKARKLAFYNAGTGEFIAGGEI